MHWLNDRIGEVDELARRMVLAKATNPLGSAAGTRRAFLREVSRLAEQIAARDGVTACVIGHDGLVLARAGRPANDESVAALGASTLLNARRTGHELSLGGVRQVVLVGDEHKLALFALGPLTLAILAPTDVNLSAALA